MASLIGGMVQEWRETDWHSGSANVPAILRWVESAKPAAMRLMTPAGATGRGACEAILTRSPNTQLIGWRWDMSRDPRQAAQQCIEAHRASGGHIRWWQWFNEWSGGPNGVPWSEKALRQLARDFAIWAKVLHDHGLWASGPVSSVGTPHVYHMAALAELMEVTDFWDVHEYGAPEIWSEHRYARRTGDRNVNWYMLRHRRAVEFLRAAGIRVPELVITECFIDGGIYEVRDDQGRVQGWRDGWPDDVPNRPPEGWDGKLPGRGWKHFADRFFPGGWRSEEAGHWFARQAMWLDKQLRTGPVKARAACIFETGAQSRGEGNWDDFDIFDEGRWSAAAEILADYMRQAAPVDPTPPPPPRPEPPVVVVTKMARQLHETVGATSSVEEAQAVIDWLGRYPEDEAELWRAINAVRAGEAPPEPDEPETSPVAPIKEKASPAKFRWWAEEGLRAIERLYDSGDISQSHPYLINAHRMVRKAILLAYEVEGIKNPPLPRVI